MSQAPRIVKGKLKAIIVTVVAWAAWCAAAAVPSAASEVHLEIGGTLVTDRYPPLLTAAGFMVPVNLIEHFGGEVHSDGERYVLRYTSSETVVRPGAAEAVTARGTKALAERPVEMGGTLYVPLGLMADMLQLRVNWDPGQRVLSLSRWSALSSVLGRRSGGGRLDESAGPGGDRRALPSAAEEAGGEEGRTVATAPPRVAATLIVPGAPTTASFVGPAPFRLELPAGPPVARTERQNRWDALKEQTGLALERETVDGSERFTLRAEGEIEVTTALLVEPFRLVVDIAGAPGQSLEPWAVASAVVRQVRARSHEGNLRLVFDLEEGVGHRVEEVGAGEVAIVFNRPLYGIAVEPAPYGGRVRLDVHPNTPYRVTHLKAPDRIVVDLEGTTLLPGPTQVDVAEGPVARVRAAQFSPQIVRLVLELKEPEVPVWLEAGESVLVAHYGEDDGSLIAYRPIDSRRLLIGARGVSAEDISVVRLYQPDRIAIDFKGLQLPAGKIEEYLDTGPVFRLRAAQLDAERVRVVADLRFHVTFRVVEARGRTAVLLEQPLLAGRRIAIDPGHGGHDPGALSASGQLTEAFVNLDISRRLEALLRDAEALPLMTRTGDGYVDLWSRSDQANEFGAEVFVSIHNNASRTGNAAASGTETYVQPGSEASVRLGQSIQQSVVSALGTQDRGLRPNPGYIVLNRTRAPAVLVEVAFVTHPEDEALLSQDWFRQRAAEGIFNGLLQYFEPSQDERGAEPLILEGETSGRWIALAEGPADPVRQP